MLKINRFPFAPKRDKRLKKWEYLKDAIKMDQYIKDGDIIYDCGANIFDHSVFFAVNHPSSKIVSFEPIKEYFDMGLKNASHFGVENIIPMNVALGEKRSKMQISISNEGSSLVHDHKNSKFETINVETIDYLVENNLIPAPDIIKIDVEGFALPLIRGAQKTIKKFKPLIFIEVHPPFVGVEESRKKIILLQQLGLNIVDRLSADYEFVMSTSEPKFNLEEISADIEKSFELFRVSQIRSKFDTTSSKIERRKLLSEYLEIRKKHRIPLFEKMIWSQLFVFFTFKWLK